ncbi:MAG: type I methionyl aminopeptidase [Lachnospiraceae bacterium]|nr:type I methionyl aminopeptidase [Lachnospiraceae bacterium]
MAVTIKTQKEIEKMREAGKILGEIHDKIGDFIKPGMTTFEVDAYGEKLIRDAGCIPECKGYGGFPAAFCTSVNECVVHGIPSKKIVLKEGDILTLDTVLSLDGYMADAARTWPIGKVSDETKKFMDVTKQAFYEGIKFAHAGNHLFEISKAVQDYVESFGYGIIREYVGHGIGKDMHEDPEIPNFKPIGRGMKLRPGMTICVEPMTSMGDYAVWVLDDDWTAVTVDESYTCHHENTILITEDEPEILTVGQSM